jgi:hypothetical protein
VRIKSRGNVVALETYNDELSAFSVACVRDVSGSTAMQVQWVLDEPTVNLHFTLHVIAFLSLCFW